MVKLTMKLSQEAKSMIATMALVLAIALGMNMAVAPDADRGMFSWMVSLLAVAILFWIWIRRDAVAERDVDAVEAADEAARQAEELARRTIVRHEEDVAAPATPDDLTKLIGVGLVFETILNDAGITTYAQLAVAPLEDLSAIIEGAGRSRPGRLETWPRQAEYAAAGDWDGLREYMDSA